MLLGQNLAEILFLLQLAFWRNRLQKHNRKKKEDFIGDCRKNSKKTQRLTHLWPKARSPSFSEWTVATFIHSCKKKKKLMFPPGIEPGTFRVLGERDNRYTMETTDGVAGF